MHKSVIPVDVRLDYVTSRITELVVRMVVVAVDASAVLESVFGPLLRCSLVPLVVLLLELLPL